MSGDRDSELACVIRDTDMIDSVMAGVPFKVCDLILQSYSADSVIRSADLLILCEFVSCESTLVCEASGKYALLTTI